MTTQVWRPGREVSCIDLTSNLDLMSHTTVGPVGFRRGRGRPVSELRTSSPLHLVDRHRGTGAAAVAGTPKHLGLHFSSPFMPPARPRRETSLSRPQDEHRGGSDDDGEALHGEAGVLVAQGGSREAARPSGRRAGSRSAAEARAPAGGAPQRTGARHTPSALTMTMRRTRTRTMTVMRG